MWWYHGDTMTTCTWYHLLHLELWTHPITIVQQPIHQDQLKFNSLIVFWVLQVAKENGTTLPSAGLFVVRFHSFYRKHYETNWSPHSRRMVLDTIMYPNNYKIFHYCIFLQLYTRREHTHTWWMRRIRRIWSGSMYSSKWSHYLLSFL